MPTGTVCTPANEAQARTITNLTPQDQVKVAQLVKDDIGDREPTTKDFEAAKSQWSPIKATRGPRSANRRLIR